eukprot:3033615-Prymnesium_polylepis.2
MARVGIPRHVTGGNGSCQSFHLSMVAVPPMREANECQSFCGVMKYVQRLASVATISSASRTVRRCFLGGCARSRPDLTSFGPVRSRSRSRRQLSRASEYRVA